MDNPQPIHENSETISTQSNSNSETLSSLQSTQVSLHSEITAEGKIILPLGSCSSTQRYCFICKSPNSRTRVPDKAIAQVWREKKIFIPRNNRCCHNHLNNDLFTEDAMQLIQIMRRRTLFSEVDLIKFIGFLTPLPTVFNSLSFGIASPLTSIDYANLTGLNKDDFNDLYSFCSGNIRNSSNRSARDALGIFLMKLRLNISQATLATMFRLDSQPMVSSIFDSVMNALTEKFVPTNLGYQHKSREDFIAQDQCRFAEILLKADPESSIVVADGTYLYIQKPSDCVLQRKTYSNHKCRNLVKPMMFVTTTGRIISADGPFFANNSNNDASILKDLIEKPESELMNLF